MAGKLNHHDDDAIVDINITPFVDVVLVLLVIFMVTAQFIVPRGMDVELPTAASAQQLKQQKTLHISLTRDQRYALEGQVLSLPAIISSVSHSSENKSQLLVTIRADKGVVYDSVIQLMDALRLVGVSQFALQLKPEKKI